MNYNADMIHDERMEARTLALLDVTKALHRLAVKTRNIGELTGIEKARKVVLELIDRD